jgi:hypothetical protein
MEDRYDPWFEDEMEELRVGGSAERLSRAGLERIEPSNTEPAVVLDVASGDHEVVLEGSRGDQEILDRLAGLAMLKACPATADRSRQGED